MEKNWRAMPMQNRGGSIEAFVKKAKAQLEHIFGNHQYCDEVWCLTKIAEKEKKPYAHENGFLSKIKDAKIYADLHAIVLKYGSPFFSCKAFTSFQRKQTKLLTNLRFV
mmetsp:Transcript_33413/g.40467  ORF Transcript_33413/g.40467 Transcript_33413/m.40467 type:complete len:109 (+) Transcript_33413:81-407(+)